MTGIEISGLPLTKDYIKRMFINGSLLPVEDVNLVDKKKWTNSINVVYFDSHNNIWLGALQGFALAISTQSPFLKYFESADLKTKISKTKLYFLLTTV